MSESARKIIKYFCDRFLELDHYPTSISAVLDLPIKSLKSFNKTIVKEFNNLNIKLIRDFTKLTTKDIKALINKKNVDPIILQNALIGANLISNAWNKRASYAKKAKTKVVVAGLDFAGKTSLINRLISDYSYTDMINLKPTVGYNIEEFQSNKLNLILWDLGGQKNYLEEYLREPEKYFVQVDVLIYVIDTQDDVRYDISMKYLSDILDILDFLTEFPYIMILLNKADSDLVNDPDFRIKLEYLTEKITNIFVEKQKNWHYDLITTSIYSFYNEPEIVKSIKSVFASQKTITTAKKETEKIMDKNIQMEESMQRVLDINLKLIDKIATELSEVKSVLFKLAPSHFSKAASSVPFEDFTAELFSRNRRIVKTQKKKEIKEKGKKKEVSEKEKKKEEEVAPSAGIPKRLPTLPVPKSLQSAKTERMDGESLQEVKEKLTLPSPEVSDLKPPPPPPKLASVDPQRAKASLRSDIISELRALFGKRGVISK